MTNTDYPSATPQVQQSKNNTKNIFIGFLAVALLGSWAWFLMQSNKASEKDQQQTQQIQGYMSQRDSLAVLYDFATRRYDSVTTVNNDLEGQLTGKKSEISKLKGEISSILRKKNASQEELNIAKTKISELNDKITNLEAEVVRLTGENQQLIATNTQLTSEKQILETNLTTTQTEKKALEETVDIGSTFSASNIQITPVNERKGGKEKETATAKKVDKLVISFDVENRITKSGPADMYIMVTAPDGKIIASPENGSGTLTTRADGDKTYTSKVTVSYDAGTRKNVELPLYQEKFQTGDYKIQVYQNGFKIGEGVRSLKKGGLFG